MCADVRIIHQHGGIVMFDEAVEKLNTWGAWSREKKSPRTCGSAEGKYRSEQYEVDRAPHVCLSVRDAVKADIIIRKMPARYKWLLVSVHVYGRGYVAPRDAEVLRFLKRKGFALTYDEQISEHKNAVQMFFNNYRKNDN